MRLTPPLSLILFLILSINGYGQNVDSLKTALIKATRQNDPHQFALLKQISGSYMEINLDSAQYYAEELIRRVEKDERKLDLAKGYNALADVFNMQGAYEEALYAIEKSIQLCEELGSQKGKTVGTHIRGNILQNLHRYDEAEQAYQESLDLAETNKDSAMIARNYANLGINSDYLGDLDQAFKYYFSAVDIYEKIDDILGQAQVYNNIGTIYEATGQIDKCIAYYNKSILYKRQAGSDNGLAKAFYNLASIYINTAKLEEASSMLDSSLLYATKVHLTSIMPYIYYGQGNILNQKKRYEAALNSYNTGLNFALEMKDPFRVAIGEKGIGSTLVSLKKYSEALPPLKASLDYAQEIHNYDLELEALKQYIRVLKHTGQYQQASKYYERLLVINDSLYSQKQITALNEVEAKYQLSQRETENQLLKNEKEIQSATIRKQKITLYGVLLVVTLLGVITLITYRRNQERRRVNEILREKNKKIELLHKELNHRVKNNLAFISGLMRMQGRRLKSEEARQAVKVGESRIEAMSLLHRKLYQQESRNSINLGEYLEELCGYLKSIYPAHDRLPVIKLDIADVQANDEAAVCIGLIINELVTNSFKYAFKDQPQPRISIHLEKTENVGYRLSYRDNGGGLPKDFEMGQSPTLGLKLIQILTNQLQGNLEVKREAGAHFQFDFNVPKIV